MYKTKLRAIPKNIFSQKYDLFLGEEHITQLSLSQFKEYADFMLGQKRIEIVKKSALKSDFQMKVNGESRLLASKRSVWSYTTDIEIQGELFMLKRKNWYSRMTELWFEDQKVGEISPVNWYSRKAEVDLPESIPIEIRVFFLLITIFYWNREAAAAAAS